MTPEFVVQIIHDMFMTAFWLSAPLLAVGFCVGVLISLVQIVTSIQDSAFNAIPRLVAFLIASLFTMPWMLRHMTTYTADILGNLARYAK
jgi:flagellar biosynthetic protein FliQ